MIIEYFVNLCVPSRTHRHLPSFPSCIIIIIIIEHIANFTGVHGWHLHATMVTHSYLKMSSFSLLLSINVKIVVRQDMKFKNNSHEKLTLCFKIIT